MIGLAPSRNLGVYVRGIPFQVVIVWVSPYETIAVWLCECKLNLFRDSYFIVNLLCKIFAGYYFIWHCFHTEIYYKLT